MEPPDLIVFGSLTIDNVIDADGLAMPPVYGGNVLYSALGARLWTDGIGIVSACGEDYPTECFEMLSRAGINAEGIVRKAGRHRHNVAFAYQPDGSRTRDIPSSLLEKLPLSDRRRFTDSSTQSGGMITVTESSADADAMPAGWWSSAKAIHLASMPEPLVLSVVKTVRQRLPNSYIQIDSPWMDRGPGRSPATGELLAIVDVVAPSEQDLDNYQRDQPHQPYEQICAELRQAFKGSLVVKRGSRGSSIYDKAGRIIDIGIADVAVVDPTGAGDSFCGGLLAGMYLTEDLVTAVHMGTVSASFCVAAFGIGGFESASGAEAKDRLERLAAKTRTTLKSHRRTKEC